MTPEKENRTSEKSYVAEAKILKLDYREKERVYPYSGNENGKAYSIAEAAFFEGAVIDQGDDESIIERLRTLPDNERMTYMGYAVTADERYKEISEKLAAARNLPVYSLRPEWKEKRVQFLKNMTLLKAYCHPGLRELLYDDENRNKAKDAIRAEAKDAVDLFFSLMDAGIDGRSMFPVPNEEQRKAISGIEKGETRVIAAVPGAGKTFSMVLLAEHEIITKEEKPAEITMISFSTAAAEEIRKRFHERNPYLKGNAIRISTAHALARRIITRYEGKIPELIQDDEKKAVIQNNTIEKLKAVATDEPLLASEKFRNDLPLAIETAKQNKENAQKIERIALSCGIRPETLDLALRIYEEEKEKLGKIDFEDMINKAIDILNGNPQARVREQSRAKLLIVDEYQDTSLLQRRLEDALRPDGGKKVIVGDDDQGIFATLGADPEIFRTDAFSEKNKLFKLCENHRSARSILELSNSLSKGLGERIYKDCKASENAAEGEKPVFALYSDSDEEIKAVGTSIKNRILAGERPEGIAVLCRTRQQADRITRILRLDPVTVASLALEEDNPLEDIVKSSVTDEVERIAHVLEHPEDGNAVASLLSEELGYMRRDDAREDERELMKELESSSVPIAVLGRRLSSGKERIGSRIRSFTLAFDEAQKKESLSDALRQYVNVLEKNTGGGDKARLALYGSVLEEAEIRGAERKEADLFFKELREDARTLGKVKKGITVTTIHKSKGLEWNSVYVPFMSGEIDRFITNTPKELRKETSEEMRRLVYVAVTRAKNNLVISSALSRYSFLDMFMPHEKVAEFEDGKPVSDKERRINHMSRERRASITSSSELEKRSNSSIQIREEQNVIKTKSKNSLFD